MEKQCCKCNQVKPISEFGNLSKSKDGLNYHCKPCDRKKGKSYYDKNTEIILKKNNDYRKRTNYDKVNQKRNTERKSKRYHERYKNDPEFRFMEQVRGNLQGVKNRKVFKDLWDEVRKDYDEKGISYDIDHLIPRSWFLVRTPKHLINHLDNLQVIDRNYNRSKKDRWSDPVPSEYLDKVRPYVKKKFEGLLKSL